jgi:signal transduction histidine kinase/ligand-binding sensor domain-containing protein/ActR/RegA family two-component response regulator
LVHSLFSSHGYRALARPVVVTCLLGCLSATALAQRYSFQSHGSDDGLKNLSIEALHQDRTGFIWVATRNGFYRYDGYRFQMFDQRRGLPSPVVIAVAESDGGTLFAATTRGLAWRVGNAHFERASNSSILNDVAGPNGLVADGKGNLFAATRSGLAMAPIGDGKKLLEFRQVTQEPAWAVVKDPDGDGVWFLCGSSLCTYRNGAVEKLGGDRGLPEAAWRALRFDSHRKLWVRSEDAVYAASDNRASRFRQVGAAERLANLRTRPFLSADSGGGMWTNSSDGVVRMDDSAKSMRFGVEQGLASEGVSEAFEDREGSMWFGFDGAGLDRWLGGPRIRSFTRAEGLPDDNVQAIADDGAGGVWIGHASGSIEHGVDSGWKTYQLPTPAADVKAIVRTRPGALLILTRRGGVVGFDVAAGRGRILGREEGLPEGVDAAIPLRFVEGRDGRAAIAFSNGVYEATTAGATHFAQVTSFPEGIVAADVLKDRHGCIWVAHAGGLAVQELAREWQKYTDADNLAPGGVARLAEGPKGEIWLSYRDRAGVARLSPDEGAGKYALELTHFRQGRGLTSDLIHLLQFDSQGRLWAGSDQGVDVYDGDRWRHLGQSQGLIWDEVNEGAAFATADGGMWIGTRRGLTRVSKLAGESPGISLAGQTFISGIDSAGKWLDPTSAIALNRRLDSITIRYSALNIAGARAMKYRYRVIGGSEDWVETGGHQVTLSSLSPGQYRFEVQSRTAGGKYGSASAAVEFTVGEPFWQSGWVRAAALGILMGAIGWRVYRRRVERMNRERNTLELAVAERTHELETEKARAEKQNREIERLLDEAKQGSRLKGEFLANMSHEIRTPMNGIIGMINLALATPLGGDQRDYVETAKNSAQALLTILNDVLDYSKVEAGHLAIEAEPFSLRELALEACKVFQPRAADRGIGLEFDASEAVPATVVGDPGRIRQVLLNLIGNSIKFTHHGQVRVSVTREDGQSENRILLHFIVEDTGIGISQDKQKVIFDAFRQADGSTTRRYGGTGLGLSISLKLVSLMGGKLWVESEPGKGSRFHFTIAAGVLTEAGERETRAASDLSKISTVIQQSDSARRALRILMAEDNLVNQRVAARLLEMRGHSVKVVENGAEALQALDRAEVFDLILMDVQMPEMDGIEATRLIRVREELHGGHVPIVAMTAHTMKGDRERCLAAGMDAYVNKPIEPGTFFRTVEGAVPAPVSK